MLPAGRLIEASFTLWQRSWRQTALFGLIYALASLLPALAFHGVLTDVMMRMAMLLARDLLPTLPMQLPLPAALGSNPAALFDLLLTRLQQPLTWLLIGVSVLAMVASTTALLRRQHGIAQGADPGLGTALLDGLRRTPATLAAWLIYLIIVLLAAAPFIALTAGAFVFGMNAGIAGLLIAMLVILVGGLLSSVPLAWASVALGFSPLATALEGAGPLSAQQRSMRLVRGHWWRSAIVVSMPLLISMGASGAVSSLVLFTLGSAVFALHGWMGLFDPGWLLWSQLLVLPAQAVLLPLAFAGSVVMFDELRLTAPPTT